MLYSTNTYIVIIYSTKYGKVGGRRSSHIGALSIEPKIDFSTQDKDEAIWKARVADGVKVINPVSFHGAKLIRLNSPMTDKEILKMYPCPPNS